MLSSYFHSCYEKSDCFYEMFLSTMKVLNTVLLKTSLIPHTLGKQEHCHNTSVCHLIFLQVSQVHFVRVSHLQAVSSKF